MPFRSWVRDNPRNCIIIRGTANNDTAYARTSNWDEVEGLVDEVHDQGVLTVEVVHDPFACDVPEHQEVHYGRPDDDLAEHLRTQADLDAMEDGVL